MSTATTGQIFRFGDFTLDLGRGLLQRGDENTFLRPKAFAVLTNLAQNHRISRARSGICGKEPMAAVSNSHDPLSLFRRREIPIGF